MLLRLSVENYKSFDQREELSLISSSKIQTNKNYRLKIKQTNILKNLFPQQMQQGNPI